MMRQTITLIFLLFGFSLTVFAQGTQFITGPCSHDSDCASSCCGFNSGKCAGPVIAQTRDGGCGHGDAQPNDIAAQAFRASQGLQNSAAAAGTTMATVMGSSPTPVSGGATTPAAVAAGAKGTQFITGPCQSDADCADSCCGFNSGKCAGPVVAQERDGGCGHGDAQPNANAARLLGYTGPVGRR